MFKDRLRATRISRGFTAQMLADQLCTGLRNYQKYESGDARPTFEGLIILADFLNVPVDFLLERDNYHGYAFTGSGEKQQPCYHRK